MIGGFYFGETMKISDEGLRRIRKSEGLFRQVYDDSNGRILFSYEEAVGNPTIGIGHLIKASEREYYSQYLGGRDSMSESQAWELYRQDVQKHIDPWASSVETPVTQEMIDAMASLAFNVGVNASSLKKTIAAINERDYEGAADAIRNGPTTMRLVSGERVVMPGLVRRRQEEADWFLSGGLPKVKFIPWLLGGSVMLLAVSLYVRSRQKR